MRPDRIAALIVLCAACACLPASKPGPAPGLEPRAFLPVVARSYPLRPLANPGFEEPWQEEGGHDCLALLPGGVVERREVGNVFAPPGWLFWFAHEPGTWDQPEARLTDMPMRVHEGDWAYQWFVVWRNMRAGLLQQAQVPVGTHLTLTGLCHAWSNSHGGLHPDDAYWSEGAGYLRPAFKLEGDPTAIGAWQNFTFKLGVDPTGGIDPRAPTVVWGQGAHIYNGYAEVPAVQATAWAMTVTVFVSAGTKWQFKHNDAHCDEIILEGR